MELTFLFSLGKTISKKKERRKERTIKNEERNELVFDSAIKHKQESSEKFDIEIEKEIVRIRKETMGIYKNNSRYSSPSDDGQPKSIKTPYKSPSSHKPTETFDSP